MTNKQSKKLIWILILAGVVLIIIWLGLKGWRSYQAAQSLLASQAEIEILMADGIMNVDPDAAENLVNDIRQDVVVLDNEWGFIMPIAPYFGWLPQVGPLVAAAPQLLEMADAGTEAAAYAFRGLKPALTILQSDDDSGTLIPDLLTIMATAKPDLIAASNAMDRVGTARVELGDTEALPWRIRTLLEKADPWLPRGQAGLKLTTVLPEIMGLDGPKRYLIMAQNKDEIRPTGGFISGAGMLEVENGAIINLKFDDANLVDAWNVDGDGWWLTKPYDTPPQALTDLMLLDLFLFRDANFWPDFPTSAEQALDLYSYGQDIGPLDGAIAIDQQFLQLLIEATGSVTIPDSGEVISSGNLLQTLHDSWSLEGHVLERKSFLGPFAAAIQERVISEFGNIDPVYLSNNIFEAAETGHFQMYMRDPELNAAIIAADWHGRLPQEDKQDYLQVVDTNVGYNKANQFIERELQYHVTLADDGSATADMTISHIHTGTADDQPCVQGTVDEYVAKSGYLALADKCFFNYLRVYVPGGSTLIAGPNQVVPGDIWYGNYDWDKETAVAEEIPGFTTFSNFIYVPKGQTVNSSYQYQLPTTITHQEGSTINYKLLVEKQAGADPYPTEINITLPPGKKLQTVLPQPTTIEGQTIQFVQELARDIEISLTYQ